MAQRWSRRSFVGLTSGFSALGVSLCATKAWGQSPASCPYRKFNPHHQNVLRQHSIGVAWREAFPFQEVALLLPFQCNKEKQTAASAGTKRRSKIADSSSDVAHSSNVQHTAAKGG